MAFGTPQEGEHLDVDFIEGNLAFDVASDCFSETAEELYALYCDFWDTPPFSHLSTEPDHAYQTAYAIYVRARVHRRLSTSFRQILLHTALKILAIRKYACKFLPCLQKNLLENPHIFPMNTSSKG